MHPRIKWKRLTLLFFRLAACAFLGVLPLLRCGTVDVDDDDVAVAVLRKVMACLPPHPYTSSPLLSLIPSSIVHGFVR